uniref:Ig-like domain-containing protein n=1 Tax=Sus scrofa TaxID=9823 RepID=A0A8D0PAJ6_PIG
MGHSLLWFSLLLGLLTGPGVSRVDSAPVVVTGTLGGSVTLPLMLPVGQHVESIFWMCHSVPGAIATVTLEEAGGPDIFYQAETRYWDRLSVMGPGRSLQISHLSWEDAGPYQAHINLRNSHIPHTWEYSLNVYGPGILGEDTMGEIVIGTLGKSATLPLEVPVGQEVEKVTWSSRGLVATLQPGRAGKPILVDGTQGPYSRRLSVPQHGYSLQISPLRLQDSGPFRAWITLHNPPINITKDFTLRVYEHLQEPSITASSQIMEDGTCLVTLACSLDQAGEDVQYSWDPRGRRTVVSHGGSTLNISWRSGVSDSYRCTVENPISQSSGSIPIRPLCSASYLPRSWRKEFLLFLVLVALQIEQI